ncbi:dihydrofolate reductase family protein [Yaniella halotolerans]|uniref:dihydrofolate reductase family protein n=1 Tax=Yaniella halotolerans TaxID=225453 RepID=UPI0003B4BABA|nr:dihydrofolate reductase family protein [Yaniella halotolerans]
MKLSINLFTTLNGVSQAPGGPEEDTRSGFTDGGWIFTVWDNGCGQAVDRWFSQGDALLLGRATYDIFAGYWPQVTDPDHDVATFLNTAQKYVVTSSPVDGPWADTTSALGGAFLEKIAELKASGGDKELQVHGSIQLARTLHEAGLVNLYRFLVLPVTVGPGAGLFDGTGPSYKMNVQHGVVTENGVFDVEMVPEQLNITQQPTVSDGKETVENI